MSRKPFIAGNWKMNKNPEEAKAFVEAVASKLPSSDLVEAGIAAPAVDLTTVLAAAKGSNLKVAAQNTYFENAGAFTGETSPQVLKEICFQVPRPLKHPLQDLQCQQIQVLQE